MNSVRQKATSKVWTPDDFLPEKKEEVREELQCTPVDEVYDQLMKYMPPSQ